MKRKGSMNKAKQLAEAARGSREAEANASSDEYTENSNEGASAPSPEQQGAGEEETHAASSGAADGGNANACEASETAKMATPMAIARVFDIDKDDPDSWCSVGLLTNTECHQTMLTDEAGIKSFCDLPPDEQAALVAHLGSDDVQTVCFHHRRFYQYVERHKQGCLDRLYLHEDKPPSAVQVKVTSQLAESCRDVVEMEEGERLCQMCIDEIKRKQESSNDAPSKRNSFSFVLSSKKYLDRAKRIDEMVTRCSVGLMTRSLCRMNMDTFEKSLKPFSTLSYETAETLVFRLGQTFDNICVHHERLYLEGYGAPCFDPESKHLSQSSSVQKWLVPRSFSLACRGRYPLRPGRTICIKCLKSICNKYPEIAAFYKEEEKEMREKLAQLADVVSDDEKPDMEATSKKVDSKKEKLDSSKEKWKYDSRGRRRRNITTVERQLRNLRVDNPEFSDVLGSLDTEPRQRQKRKVAAKVKTFDAANYNSSSSDSGDDEWKPSRRQAARRVNPLRSQATKLMWKRKKAAALLLQQQDNEGGAGPSAAAGSSSHLATVLPQSSSLGMHTSSRLPAKQSVAAQQVQQPQLPLRKRSIQTSTNNAGSGQSGRTGRGLGKRSKRVPSLSLSWMQRRLAKLRLAKFRAHDPLSRAILRRDTARLSMCWSDTTLGSSLAGRSSARTEIGHAKVCQPASFVGGKAYHHVASQSTGAAAPTGRTVTAAAAAAPTGRTATAAAAAAAAPPTGRTVTAAAAASTGRTVSAVAAAAAAASTGRTGIAAAVASSCATSSSKTETEVPSSQAADNGSARPGLARACRPTVLREEPTSSSEHSDDDCVASSLARSFERLASSPVRQLLQGGPRMRPRLLQASQPGLDETVEQGFSVPAGITIKIEDDPQQSYAVATPRSKPPVQRQSVPNAVPCTNKFVPWPNSRCTPRKVHWDHQYALEEEAATDRMQESSAASLQYARASGGDQQQLSSLLTMPFPFTLPAKLRWKREMAAERLQAGLPPKLRYKQQQQPTPMWKGAAHHLQAAIRVEPGIARYAGVPETPFVTNIKTEPRDSSSERRSQAKRQWWQQLKQLDWLAGNGSPTTPEKREEIMNTLPKFLLKELFPSPTATRGKKKPKAAAKAEGPPSRRSLIMKESWRRRKAAWLSAAEQSLSGAAQHERSSASNDPHPNSSSSSSIVVKQEPVDPTEVELVMAVEVKKEPVETAVQVKEETVQVKEELGPEEEGIQYLARTRALRKCRQYRQNLIAQADCQQSSRPLRHYNARGIHIATNKDMCDCLRLECPGCHFPCPKCGSSKCGDECRCNRNYTYEQIEIDGRPDIAYVNPLLS